MPLPMTLLNETISGLKKESVYDALSNVYHQWFVYYLFSAFSSSMSAIFWFYLPISFQFIAISVMPWHYLWYFILLHILLYPEFKILVQFESNKIKRNTFCDSLLSCIGVFFLFFFFISCSLHTNVLESGMKPLLPVRIEWVSKHLDKPLS